MKLDTRFFSLYTSTFRLPWKLEFHLSSSPEQSDPAWAGYGFYCWALWLGPFGLMWFKRGARSRLHPWTLKVWLGEWMVYVPGIPKPPPVIVL